MSAPQVSLTRKLTVATGLSLLVMVVAILIVSTVAMRRFMDRYVMDTALPAQLEKIRGEAELVLQPSILLSRAMAQNIWQSAFLSGGEPSAEQAAEQSYLQSMRDGNKALNAYLVSGLSMNYYTQDGVLKKLDSSGERDQWFFRFVNSGQDYELVLDRDQTSDGLTIYLNYAVKQGGKTVAVTGISRSADEMGQLIRQLKLGTEGYVFVANAQGQIQIHNDKALLGKEVDSDPHFAKELKTRILDAKETLITNQDGYYVAVIPLRSSSWKVIAIQPESEVFGGITQTLWLTILIASAIAVLSLLVIMNISRRLLQPVHEAAQALNEIGRGGGDLRQRLPVSDVEETALLANGFNQFAQSLQTVIRQVDGNANQVAEVAHGMLLESGNMLGAADQQQRKTELVATAVNEMGATVNEIARSAAQAAESAKRATEEANAGKQIVLDTAASIDRLAREMSATEASVSQLAGDVTAIGQVSETIRGISEQTNLLALNAAIEAARAGEQGRGFAVVADEVRNLAQRTQQSTEEIRNTIERLQQNAHKAVQAMHTGQEVVGESVERARRAGQSLIEINTAIDKISAMNYQIATATEQQSTVTEDINANVTSIATVARETRDTAQRSQLHCETLDGQAAELKRLMANFRI